VRSMAWTPAEEEADIRKIIKVTARMADSDEDRMRAGDDNNYGSDEEEKEEEEEQQIVVVIDE